MKVSVCVTVYNEEKSIEALLKSLVNQSKKPDQIVIVDGGSADDTVNMIKRFRKHSRFKKLNLIVKKCTRAEGRNISVREAKYDIIAMTDADCIAKHTWLEKITEPFEDKGVGVVAGFYDMVGETSFQKAEAVFLGVMPDDFDEKTFLPSTRSIAFRRSAWEKIGGYPEKGNNSAEDTDFNYLALANGIRYSRVKTARVGWRIPFGIQGFHKKNYDYAKWDAKNSRIWEPSKGITSHNIIVLLKLFRYAFFAILFILSLSMSMFIPLLFVLLLYAFYSFYKVFMRTRSVSSGSWGILLQFISDFSGIWGFVVGIMQRILGYKNLQPRERGHGKVFKILMYLKFIYLFTRNWAYLKLGRKVILCLGDSHMTIFEDIERSGKFNKTHFSVFAIGGATAMGMGNPLSKTKAYSRYMKFLRFADRNSHVLIGLGEVDCGFVIWYRKDKYNTSVSEQLKYALKRYQKFLLEIKKSGYKNILVLSAQPPTIMDGRDRGNVAKLRVGIKATLKQRTELTRKFNHKMQEFCERENINYLDIFGQAVGKNGVVSKKYLSDDVFDHHLNSETTIPIIMKALTSSGYK